MMELVVGDSLSRTFRRGANEEAYRRYLWQQREQQDRARRQKDERFDQAESDLIDLASTIITTEQAELFQTEIDTYQTATIEALNENREEMERVREHLDRIMERAYRLEDGRRVFKTEDGSKVFDENGVELGPEIIAPEDIPDDCPRWEETKDALDALERLEAEQKQLLDYQSQLDDAQELLDSGKMTPQQFDELRERLAAEAPEAVKARVQEIGSDNEASVASSALNAEINLDSELAVMSMPKPFVPGGGS